MKRFLTMILAASLLAAGALACDGDDSDDRDESTHQTDTDSSDLEPVDEDADEDDIYDPDSDVIAEARAELAANAPADIDIEEIRCQSDDDCGPDEECDTDFNVCIPDEEAAAEEREQREPDHDFYTDVVDHAIIYIDGIVSPADEARIEEAIDDLETVREVEVVAGDRISVVYDRQRRHYDDLKAIIDNLGYDSGSVTVSPRE